MKVFVISVVVLQILDCYSFIIPDELPSILSVIYSNIPTLKKGTDSRIGWGFRLGDRADFQVITELGPQTNTQPLANQGDSNANKRNALNNLADTLYAQRQQEKRLKQEKEKEENSKDTEGSKWLKTWSKSVIGKEENDALPMVPRPGLGIGEIDAKSVIPEDSVLEAQVKEEEKKLKGRVWRRSSSNR
ncbi:hypothetical protein NQ317_008214 [Molorchus minor]|uniref:Secreted protein n=1 Tax=Molorchus minor TaxID=1323400 RepID=A0ABQ9JVE2_9CUCU|nr:hypothetical protein NQ317_008214 [Molorchus minor]